MEFNATIDIYATVWHNYKLNAEISELNISNQKVYQGNYQTNDTDELSAQLTEAIKDLAH